MTDDGEEASNTANNKLLIEAMTAKFEQMMAAQITALRQELKPASDAEQERSDAEHHFGRRGMPRANRYEHGDEEATDYYGSSSDHSQRSNRSQRQPRVAADQRTSNLNGLKLKIPPFHGKNDPDAYLEWEKKIELVFDCQYYTEESKVKLAATEFYDYALSWWDQLVTTRRRNGELPIRSWRRMKVLLSKRFVPGHYNRELHQRLRRLTQGSKSVEDYFQEMETLMLRADISEDREATMARFLGGLNREIQDQVEMQHYVDLEEMLHKATLIEQQFARRGKTRSSFGNQ